MSEIVERVRDAIIERLKAPEGSPGYGFELSEDEQTVSYHGRDLNDVARAAIEAIRVLTPEMERAGLKALAAAGVGSPLPGWAAQDCMNAVIAAALSNEPAISA